jgi:poly-gamma-glutamate system protein
LRRHDRHGWKDAVMRKLRDASSPSRLIVLALVLAGCFLVWRSPSLSREEMRLYARIQAAQRLLWSEMERRGQTDAANDPDRSGFIGLDWSETSTTLGNLDAKRNACDPLWGVTALRWFDALALAEDDRIAVFSSCSFPGLLYSILAAAELRGLRVDLAVSLGSSAWGANRPEAPWPVLARILSSRGFLRTRPLFYTLGGDGEAGKGMPDEGVRALRKAAGDDGVEVYAPQSLSDVIDRKMAIIASAAGTAKLVVTIGGAHSSLGTNGDVAALKNGLLASGAAPLAGNGVIAKSLELGVPVAHFLNLRSLAERSGITFAERRLSIARGSSWPAVAGVALFLLVLATHKRWSWEA